jgi:hypothetical protein
MLDERFMYLAALLICWGTYSYVKDMYQGQTRPNLVTWFLWTLAPMIAFAAQIQAGVGATAVLTFMVGFCPLVVFVAGIKRGNFRPSRFDLMCGGSSLAAILLWQLTGNGALAVILSIAADGLAASPTILKAYRDPRSESPFLFLLFAMSAAITLLTIKTWDIQNSGFSMYIFALYVLLFILVKFEPMQKRLLQSEVETATEKSTA